jgi:hypothetical protein
LQSADNDNDNQTGNSHRVTSVFDGWQISGMAYHNFARHEPILEPIGRIGAVGGNRGQPWT